MPMFRNFLGVVVRSVESCGLCVRWYFLQTRTGIRTKNYYNIIKEVGKSIYTQCTKITVTVCYNPVQTTFSSVPEEVTD